MDPSAEPLPVTANPSVLFVCVHCAGRSPMAAAYLTALAGGFAEVRSAGSAPGRSRTLPLSSLRPLPNGVWTSPTVPMDIRATASHDPPGYADEH